MTLSQAVTLYLKHVDSLPENIELQSREYQETVAELRALYGQYGAKRVREEIGKQKERR